MTWDPDSTFTQKDDSAKSPSPSQAQAQAAEGDEEVAAAASQSQLPPHSSLSPHHQDPIPIPSGLSLTRNQKENADRHNSATTLNSNVTNGVNQNSTFHRSGQIELRQQVGSMSLSPARSGLFILDLERPYDQPRFIANLTSWEVADVQWNPHPSRSRWVASTSNQKLLVWNLDRPTTWRDPNVRKIPPLAKPGAFSFGTNVSNTISLSPELGKGNEGFSSSLHSRSYSNIAPKSNLNSIMGAQIPSIRRQRSYQSTTNQSLKSSSQQASHSHQSSAKLTNASSSHLSRSAGISSSLSQNDSQISIDPSPESVHDGGATAATGSNSAIEFVLPAHTRAITDINWSAFHPDVLASCSLDTWTVVWDLRIPRKPVQSYSAWNAAMTSVKWNRASPHRMATSCDNKVLIWDSRKGSLPLCSIEAHESRIYGIDWSRDITLGHDRLVTCSLDATVKYWDLSSSTSQSAIGSRTLITEPEMTIRTNAPIWRARYLPFGEGVMTLPQRGDNAVSMWSKAKPTKPVKRFEGHRDTVKEFLWRTKGGGDRSRDDRKFQLLTWGKDQILRMWPISEEEMKAVDHIPNAPIRVLNTRAHAPDISYLEPPCLTVSSPQSETQSPNPSQFPTPTHTRPVSLSARPSFPQSGTSLSPNPNSTTTATSASTSTSASLSKSLNSRSLRVGRERGGYDLNNQGLEDVEGRPNPLDSLSRSLDHRRKMVDDDEDERERPSKGRSSGKPMISKSFQSLKKVDSKDEKTPIKTSRKGANISTLKKRSDVTTTKKKKQRDGKATASSGGYMTRGVGTRGLSLALGLGSGSGLGNGNSQGRYLGYGGVGGSASGRDALGWIEGVRMLEVEEEGVDVNADGEGEADGGDGEGEDEEVQESGAQGLGMELSKTAREWPRAMFEKIAVSERQCTISLYGPWATANVLPHPVFIRISFSFPPSYPSQPARFDLERTANVSLKTRAFLLRKLAGIVNERASKSKGCLASCISFLFGEDLLKEDKVLGSIPLDAGRRLEEIEKERIQRGAQLEEGELDRGLEEKEKVYGPYETRLSTRRNTLKMLGEVGDSDEDENAAIGSRPLLLPPTRCGASFGPGGLLVVFRSQDSLDVSAPPESEAGTETDASHSGFSAPFFKLTALHPTQVSPLLSATRGTGDSENQSQEPLLSAAKVAGNTSQGGGGGSGARPPKGAGSRFLKSYSALSSAMSALAQSSSTSVGISTKNLNIDSGVQDSDVLLLMSSDFVSRRMKDVRVGGSKSRSSNRRNHSLARGYDSGKGYVVGRTSGNENASGGDSGSASGNASGNELSSINQHHLTGTTPSTLDIYQVSNLLGD